MYEARSLGNVDVWRRVLSRETCGPEQQSDPLRHDAKHGQHAIPVTEVERLKHDERLEPRDLASFHRRPRRQVEHGNESHAEHEWTQSDEAFAEGPFVTEDQRLRGDEERWKHDGVFFREQRDGVAGANRDAAPQGQVSR